MYCNNCGKEISNDSRVCTYCGTIVSTSKNSIITKTNVVPPSYVVLQVVLKEKFSGAGSRNLSELERVINTQANKGYKLHTISTTSSGSVGPMGGDRIQATMVFEKL